MIPGTENTGATDVVIDPSNPDTMYAATWQRRRHFFTLVNGGPESAIYKSTDGGNTWARLRGGSACRRSRPHRPFDLAGEPECRVRDRRGSGHSERHLSHRTTAAQRGNA